MKRNLDELNIRNAFAQEPKECHDALMNAACSVKEEKPVKRVSFRVALVVTLIIVATVAVAAAAGFGLFGELAQNRVADDRLPILEEASELISAEKKMDDNIVVEIGQAYYEGNRVFVSYRLVGDLVSVDLHEGAPNGIDQWNDELPDFIVAEHWSNDIPELQQMNEWLNGNGQRWAESSVASLHDGLFLEDGTYLNIIGGDESVQPDGSIIGWKECEIPKDRATDTLTFKAALFRNRMINFQDNTTFRRYIDHGENTDIVFTLNRNDHFVYLKGDSLTNQYQAHVELASGCVDMKGTIYVTVPEEWTKAWSDWENENTLDMIMQWNLYQNGDLLSGSGTRSVEVVDKQELVFEQLYPHMESLEDLSLVPVYSQSGEHLNESIWLEQIIK